MLFYRIFEMEINPILMKSTAAAIFMVRPKHFGFNDQTASTNFFQNKTNLEDVATKAQLEFNTAVD